MVDVAKERFVVSKSTLEGCKYFASLFARWQPGEVVALDHEPEAFAALLRYMRSGYPSTALPPDDSVSFAMILSLADNLGLDTLAPRTREGAHLPPHTRC